VFANSQCCFPSRQVVTIDTPREILVGSRPEGDGRFSESERKRPRGLISLIITPRSLEKSRLVAFLFRRLSVSAAVHFTDF
jgi:hypothetical protein